MELGARAAVVSVARVPQDVLLEVVDPVEAEACRVDLAEGAAPGRGDGRVPAVTLC